MKFKERTKIYILILIILIQVLTFSSLAIFSETIGESEQIDEIQIVQSEQPDNSNGEETQQNESLFERMKLYEENEYLALYVEESTAKIAVLNKIDGNIWFSNPEKAEIDSIAVQETKDLLQSQISLTYYQDNQIKTMNSYKDCISLGQFEIKRIENGIRIEMRIGKEFTRYLLPKIISKESFEENIVNKVENSSELSRLNFYYNFYSLENAKTESAKKTMLEMFPMVSEYDIYVLRDGTSEREKKQIEDIINGTGFTLDQIDEEYLKLDFVDDEENLPLFNIPVEYILEEDTLLARVPGDEISYNKDGGFDLHKIRMLEFFGASDNSEEGYLFVPDGSGSLINFNNKLTKPNFRNTTGLYGQDQAVSFPVNKTVRQNYFLPVFGISKQDKAMLAVIEDGDATAFIVSEVSGFMHSYNTVYSEFIYKNAVEITVDNTIASITSWIELDRNEYTDDYSIRYIFLDNSKSDYVGMAISYREYLVDRDVLKKQENVENIPFYLELFGAIERLDSIFGIPAQKAFALTSFSDAVSILNSLKDNGVNNINVRYKGWFNGGLESTLPYKISLENVLGGKKEWENLIEFTKENNIELYPDVDFAKVSKDSWFDGFLPRRDVSRTLDRKLALFRRLDLSRDKFDEINTEYLISPNRLMTIFDSFNKRYEKFNINGLSIGTMGNYLHSDFRRTNMTNRQTSLELVKEFFQEALIANNSLMVDGGNAYTFPFVSHILNLPETDSKYLFSDKSIPFMQIVLHGYVQYAGSPLNLATDYNQALLKSIENGEGIYFVMANENEFRLKDTIYSNYCSINSGYWINRATEIYTEINNLMGDLAGKFITGHENPVHNVYITIYENGGAVAVNYNEEDVEIFGVTIKARGYARIDDAWENRGD